MGQLLVAVNLLVGKPVIGLGVTPGAPGNPRCEAGHGERRIVMEEKIPAA